MIQQTRCPWNGFAFARLLHARLFERCEMLKNETSWQARPKKRHHLQFASSGRDAPRIPSLNQHIAEIGADQKTKGTIADQKIKGTIVADNKRSTPSLCF